MSLAQYLLQTMSQAVCCCDEHGVVQASSPAARILLQHTTETLHNKSLLELVHADDIELFEDALVSLTRQGTVPPCTLRLLNGHPFAHTYCSVQVRFTGHEEGAGLLEHILLWLEPAPVPAPSQVHDQVHTRVIEHEVKARQIRTANASTEPHTVNHNTPAAVRNHDASSASSDFYVDERATALCVFSKQWRFVHLNDTAAHLVGKTADEVQGQSLWRVLPDIQHNHIGQTLQHAVEAREPVYFETLSDDPRLNFAWFGVHVLPIGEQIVVKAEDITERKYQQQQLEAAQDRIKQLFEQRNAILETVSDNVFMLDANYRFIYANSATLEAVGETLTSIRQKTLWDVVNLSEGNPFRAGYLKTIQEQVPQRVRGVSSLASLAGRTLDIAMYPFQGGLIAYSRDVTEFETLRADLAQALADKEAILNSITDAVSVIDRNWTYVYANALILERVPDIIGCNYFEVFPQHRDSVFAHHYQQAFDTQTPVFFEAQSLTNGEWAEVRVYPASDQLTIYAAYITERKQLEHALRGSEAKFRGFFEHNSTPHTLSIFTATAGHDRDFVFNGAFAELVADTAFFDQLNPHSSASIHRAMETITHPDDFPRQARYLDEVFAGTRNQYSLEKRYLKRDGEIIWVSVQAVFMRNDVGDLAYGIATIHDITERKHDEQNLRAALQQLEASEAKFRNFFEHSAVPHTLAINDLEQNTFNFLYNNALVELLAGTDFFVKADFTSLASVTAAIRHITHPADFVQQALQVEAMFASQQNYNYQLEKRYLNRDGSIIWIHIDTVMWYEKARVCQFVITTLQDITDRKQAEQALAASETKFRHFFEANSVAHQLVMFVGADKQTLHIETNQAFKVLFADSRLAELEPVMTLTDYRTLARAANHPDNPQDFMPPRAAPNSMSVRHNEKCYLNRDGSVFWCDVSKVSFYDDQGLPKVCLSSYRDISERKHAQAALEKALADKEMLLKEVHHRTKNNMQLISSMLSIQSRRIGDEMAQQALVESSKRINLLASIHRALYQTPESGNIEAGKQLKYVLEGLTLGLRDARITVHSDIAEVHLDVHQTIPLMLIANELLTNVFKHAFATPQAGDVLTVRFMLEDDRVTLEIIDNGVGVPEGAADKDSLGMVIIATLTDQLSADLTLENRPEGGTVARVSFVKRTPFV